MPNRIGDKLIADINKEFSSPTGKQVAMYASAMPPITVCHTGSLALDFAIGIGGIPENRVAEICGPEGSGKTTLALLMACQFIDKQPKRMVVVLDMEHKLTPSWVETLVGIGRMENLLVVNPDTIEQATEMYRKMVTTANVSMVILDSIGGAPTAQVMDKTRSAEKAASMGGNAQGVTKFARFAANLSAKYDCLTVGINQTRDDTKSRHGNMLQTPGGHGWKHACVLRIHVMRGNEKYDEKINGEAVRVGFNVVARCIKNQLATEGREAEWRFFNLNNNISGTIGIDTVEECVRLSTLTGVVQQTPGGWFHHAAFEGGKMRGKDNISELVRVDGSVRGTLVSEVMAALQSDPSKLADVAPVRDLDGPISDDQID